MGQNTFVAKIFGVRVKTITVLNNRINRAKGSDSIEIYKLRNRCLCDFNLTTWIKENHRFFTPFIIIIILYIKRLRKSMNDYAL